jgi:demethylmenaquinone methyltransferase/2-methoxy-6-polyprenyl-1,4-benzoquinol methylase
MSPRSPGNQAYIIDSYRRRAKGYDASGIRSLEPWRKEAVKLLHVRRGDLVVDVGCGTGLNFALLQKAIGPEGRIIGVDLTDAMLDQARQRVAQHGWKNVDLVQSDAAQYVFPDRVDGIISTFALTFVPDCARVIQNGRWALAPGRHGVVLDMAWPNGWPQWLRHLLPFLPASGITADVIQRRPWQTIQEAMDRHLTDVVRKQFWMGFFYLTAGRKSR